MASWAQLAPLLASGEDLSYEQSRDVMASIMSGELGEVRLSAFLSMLAVRGLAVNELHGLADQMQAEARRIDLPSDAVDIVGTGGDGAHTVNISTMAAIVIAAAGFPVVKHGNRASTSACGSADLLEELGVDLDLDSQAIRRSFAQADIAFLFANKFHPSMRHAARVRRELGFPTAFNVLGPLTNPARPRASAVGVARADAAPLVAGVFAQRHSSALVFRGLERGLDELSTVEPARLWATQNGAIVEMDVDPASLLGLPRSSIDDLRGGDAAHNARVAKEVLAGVGGPAADAVALNAGLGMMAAAGAGLSGSGGWEFSSTNWTDPRTLVSGIVEGFARAQEILRSGAAIQTLDTWIASTREDA